jgi:hypothetical protein
MITIKNFIRLFMTAIIVISTSNMSGMHTEDFASAGICILNKQLAQAESAREDRKVELLSNVLSFIKESGIKKGKEEEFYRAVLASKYAAALGCLENHINIYQKISGNL